MPVVASSTPVRRLLVELLAEARARTILLVSSLSDEEMRSRPDAAVQPILSELDEILRFEERWLEGEAGHQETSQRSVIGSYNEWFDAMLEVRQRTLDRLEACAGEPAVIQRCHLVLEHEYHRNEAMLETLQLSRAYRAPRRTSLPSGRRLADPGFMARFPGAVVRIGAAEDTPAWPEERPERKVEVAPFWIDVTPVTNSEYSAFMLAGGYVTEQFWSEAGWQWVLRNEVRMPCNWFWEEGTWYCRWFDRTAPLDRFSPVGPVSFYEADAFARFAGKRLPTELEWEAAASWDPEFQSRRHYPWGNMPPSPNVANLDQLAFEPAPVGAYPGNVSPVGCYGLIGDLWEWTSSDFLAPEAPGEPAPGEQDRDPVKVLRGGSWATRPGAIRSSVRKPAPAGSRHVFAGFRCAHDV